mmetsp:Transcript_6242/g.24876  ORF Transcript_6242/g.24876 Transcript_6242/m.24876 type:complete len:226 (-) Transcript_6242:124-801(-)
MRCRTNGAQLIFQRTYHHILRRFPRHFHVTAKHSGFGSRVVVVVVSRLPVLILRRRRRLRWKHHAHLRLLHSILFDRFLSALQHALDVQPRARVAQMFVSQRLQLQTRPRRLRPHVLPRALHRRRHPRFILRLPLHLSIDRPARFARHRRPRRLASRVRRRREPPRRAARAPPLLALSSPSQREPRAQAHRADAREPGAVDASISAARAVVARSRARGRASVVRR